jgi:hypothetical protein
MRIPARATYTTPPTRTAFHVPRRSRSSRATATAAARNTSDPITITRYSAVRSPMVSSLPTAGGLAGYLTNGVA